MLPLKKPQPMHDGRTMAAKDNTNGTIMRTNMRLQGKIAWVVYRMTIHKRADRMTAVCEQSEWDAMELGRPGYHILVREGIPSEVEAELLARESAGLPHVGSKLKKVGNTWERVWKT
jgi:hypothetical protein